MCPAHIHAQRCMFQVTWIKLSWSPKKHSHIAMQPSFKGASAQEWFSLLRWRTRGGPGLVRGQKIAWRKILRDSVCPPKSIVQLFGGGSVSIFKTCYHCKVKLRKRVWEIFPQQRKGNQALILPPSQFWKTLSSELQSLPYSLFHLDSCYLGQVL